MCAAAGYDCIFIDMEHGAGSLEWANQLSVAALQVGITPIVRVPTPTIEWISKALDGGAQTIFSPHTQSAAEAREIVRLAKYAPLGERSIGAYMSIMRYASPPAKYANHIANETIMVVPMIETVSALEQADEIAAVPGVDMLHVGAFDLLADMGIPGEVDSPRLFEAISKLNDVAKRASASGRFMAIGIGGFQNRPDLAKKYATAFPHLRYVTAAGDNVIMVEALMAGGKRCQEITKAVSAAS